MNLTHWGILVVVAVALVGCSGVAAEPERGRAEYLAPTQVPALATEGSEVAALEARISELEGRLDEMRWTEKEAIAVVQHRFWERVRDCRSHSHSDIHRHEYGAVFDTFGSFSGGCQRSSDPVLKGFSGSALSSYTSAGGARALMNDGAWAATYQDGPQRWFVVVNHSDHSTAFYAYEKTGLVMGGVPIPLEQLDKGGS